jgi:hypothetical protein
LSGFDIEGDAAGEELEERVDELVEERKAAGVYSPEVEAALKDRLPDEALAGTLPPIAELDCQATLAGSTWEVTPDYVIATDKGLLRPLVLFVKRFARLWARIAVGPIQRDQSTFNRHTAAALEALRREAIEQRARELADERDLAELAGSLMDDSSAAGIAKLCVEALTGVKRVTLVGPAPDSLRKGLQSGDFDVAVVSTGTAWEAGGDEVLVERQAPLLFLNQLPEGSVDAIVVAELVFWLKPERLVATCRSAYLALSEYGRLIVAVHPFAQGAPAPAWCDRLTVSKAMVMAGFTHVDVSDAGGGGYVAKARR